MVPSGGPVIRFPVSTVEGSNSNSCILRVEGLRPCMSCSPAKKNTSKQKTLFEKSKWRKKCLSTWIYNQSFQPITRLLPISLLFYPLASPTQSISSSELNLPFSLPAPIAGSLWPLEEKKKYACEQMVVFMSVKFQSHQIRRLWNYFTSFPWTTAGIWDFWREVVWCKGKKRGCCLLGIVGDKQLPGWCSGKESICQCKRCKRHEFDPWMGKTPWRKAWQSTPVSLPGDGQRSLADCSP